MLACMTDAMDMTPTELFGLLSLDDRYACYVALHDDDYFACFEIAHLCAFDALTGFLSMHGLSSL
jgi:hypothetical protein